MSLLHVAETCLSEPGTRTDQDCFIEGDRDRLSVQTAVMQGITAPLHLKGSTTGCVFTAPQQLIHIGGRFRVQIQTDGSRANNACYLLLCSVECILVGTARVGGIARVCLYWEDHDL